MAHRRTTDAITEFDALASKKSPLESHCSPVELADSEAFAALVARIEELDQELNRMVTTFSEAALLKSSANDRSVSLSAAYRAGLVHTRAPTATTAATSPATIHAVEPVSSPVYSRPYRQMITAQPVVTTVRMVHPG